MKEETKKWIAQSDADLRAAKNSLQSKDYHASVFWSQQAVEKGLKAIYINKYNSLPAKIHDLVELCRLISAPDTIILIAGKLNPAYTFSHYPGAAPSSPHNYYSLSKAKEHLQWAQDVMIWIKKQIKL